VGLTPHAYAIGDRRFGLGRVDDARHLFVLDGEWSCADRRCRADDYEILELACIKPRRKALWEQPLQHRLRFCGGRRSRSCCVKQDRCAYRVIVRALPAIRPFNEADGLKRPCVSVDALEVTTNILRQRSDACCGPPMQMAQQFITLIDHHAGERRPIEKSNIVLGCQSLNTFSSVPACETRLAASGRPPPTKTRSLMTRFSSPRPRQQTGPESRQAKQNQTSLRDRRHVDDRLCPAHYRSPGHDIVAQDTTPIETSRYLAPPMGASTSDELLNAEHDFELGGRKVPVAPAGS
jgi:hypothetical protein